MQSIFGTIGTSLVNIFVMTLGEIEFQDVFVDAELGPFTADAYLLLAVFLFLMPIVLMNLMVSNIGRQTIKFKIAYT